MNALDTLLSILRAVFRLVHRPLPWVPVVLVKFSGSVVVTGRCDHLEITYWSLSLYDPTQDPFGDDPPFYGCIPDGSLSTARRIPVQPPCEP